MSELLSPDDLAYMRETQADARPTEAQLRRRTQGATPSGGRADTWSEPVPVNVRLDGNESNVPATVVAAVGGGKAVRVTMDLVEVRSGDTLTIGQAVFQVVTDGDPDEWATAQVIWAKQIKHPGR